MIPDVWSVHAGCSLTQFVHRNYGRARGRSLFTQAMRKNETFQHLYDGLPASAPRLGEVTSPTQEML